MSKYDDGERRPGAKQSEDRGRSQELGLGKETVIPFPPLGGVQRHELGPGKQTLVPVLDWDSQPVAPVQLHRLGVPDVGKYSLIPTMLVQRSASGGPDAVTQGAAWADLVQLARGARGGQPAEDTASVHAAAAQGVATPASPLPYRDTIQHAFAYHDVSSVQAHAGPEAAASARAMGADAYATGNHIVLGGGADLRTVAHEAAHIVQQRGGVQLKGGVGATEDDYERHADAVADRVVAGQSAAALLDQMSGSGHRDAAVQRAPAMPSSGTVTGVDSEITPPIGGINKPGFIDNSDGSNLRAGPAEAGGKLLRDKLLPPATGVFVSGTHPSAQEWWYVTAYLDGILVRGYVQHGRVNTDLPEPTAKLHQVVSGDTAEKLAVQEYKRSVHDSHDLRYYENVLLYVNQHDKIPRAGIAGSYQDPGVSAAVATT